MADDVGAVHWLGTDDKGNQVTEKSLFKSKRYHLI